MEVPTERAKYFEPCFRNSAKADGSGFNTGRDCASCLRTLEKDSAHVLPPIVILFTRNREAACLNKWLPTPELVRMLVGLEHAHALPQWDRYRARSCQQRRTE